ncbi:MAG: hypothetical protein HY744_04425 [Deltaproteobacteria bacterium]|nr:hypothetical protein [Deltaproteobacteria bacterium]
MKRQALAALALAMLASAAASPLGCGARADLRVRGGAASAAGGAGAGGGPDAGPGGAAPDGGPVDGGSLDLDAIARACVIAASCAEHGPGPGIPWPAFTPSACIDAFGRLGWHYGGPGWLPDPALAQRLVGCATGADCGAFQACFGGGWVDLSRCREGGFCQGNTMVSSEPAGPSYQCEALGATCADLWSGAIRACCNAEPCDAPTEIACSGTVASWCGGWGERVDFDCGPGGGLCQPGPIAPGSPCSGTGAPCVYDDAVTCAGSVATYCLGGALASVACAATWSRTACALGDPPDLPCRPAGFECDPSGFSGACENTDVVVCADGYLVSVSCTELGFDYCELGAAGYAQCMHGA